MWQNQEIQELEEIHFSTDTESAEDGFFQRAIISARYSLHVGGAGATVCDVRRTQNQHYGTGVERSKSGRQKCTI
jgi:hypothetical protein